MSTQVTIPKVKKCGTQLCYSWTDEHGFHQYYCEMINSNDNVGNIRDFGKKENENGLIYSWNDDYGYHNYAYFN
jgi:hypothetical protein